MHENSFQNFDFPQLLGRMDLSYPIFRRKEKKKKRRERKKFVFLDDQRGEGGGGGEKGEFFDVDKGNGAGREIFIIVSHA